MEFEYLSIRNLLNRFRVVFRTDFFDVLMRLDKVNQSRVDKVGPWRVVGRSVRNDRGRLVEQSLTFV